MLDDENDLESLGPLKVLRVKGDPDAPTVVLFHGYGASAFDLYPIHEVLITDQKFNWVFPHGHLSIPLMPGYNGRAWFPIDMAALEEAIRKNDFRNFADKDPEGMDIARASAYLMLEALGVPWNQLILGGFSQGAMLATDITLRNEQNSKGLMILSGALVNESLWKDLAPKKSNLRFFQSHGEFDPILGYANAKKLEKLLRNSGMLGEFIAFSGGHEIPAPVVQGISRYLNSLS
ncbi:phospholipase/carboxylesterase [Leptospira yanagawae serovar Saopaulo str. Sao Paulo = ATCC 700523]|uniref:Phospholipase/carboxylesterase n=1 Tax=Leptospira yanagawae serovar Saopaulo str. Sao Paulo = ATCC 700523 TaxID=1249483 RepID=A0A5E8H6G9_9LEPT|nr:phospholipase/carboxylesterase [Leptospira yanagawae]EOQ87001.1 phospholipase/carboxylesterase [Leptospira yanagawae serovar Saopaulo str. Sao Paulo = ATCC 700523]